MTHHKANAPRSTRPLVFTRGFRSASDPRETPSACEWPSLYQGSCEDLDLIFGARGYLARCRCQRYKTTGDEWWHNLIPIEEGITTPGVEVTWGELFVGTRQVFAAAGFTQVSHPSKRRVVMRIDF